MNEGANCIAPEIIQAGFGMLSCWVGQATPKPGEPHQNRCTVFDEGRLPRQRAVWNFTKRLILIVKNLKIRYTIAMYIHIQAKPKSKKESIEKLDESHYKVSVKEIPEKNKANQAIIKALAEYFNVAKSEIKIISGHTSRQKIVDIDKK